MKNLLLKVALFIAISAKAQLPISLTNAHFPGMNDTLRYSNVSPTVSINYTTTGTNFNWNFSNLSPISQGVREYKLALQTPYFLFFIGFNEYGEKIADTLGAGPLTITNYYNFYRKQTSPINAYVVDGAGMTFSSVPVPSYYSDKDELYVFPLTYPSYDSTTFKFSTPTTTLLPIVYSKTGYRVTKAEGWGTITTPFGTEPCLKIVTTQYSQDSIKNTIIPFPVGFTNNQRSYQWLTTTSKIPYLEVNGNLVGSNFTITQIRYRDNYQVLNSVVESSELENALNFYPNPVKNELQIENSKNWKKIEIYNLNGQLLISQNLEKSSKNSVYVEKLPIGLYNAKIFKGNEQFIFKFIKQ